MKRFRWISIVVVLSLCLSSLGLPIGNGLSRASAEVGSLTPTPVGEWKFETMKDNMSPDTYSRNNLIASNAALGSGKFGNAMLFNGYNSYATVPNDHLIDTGSNFSISLLVYFNSTFTNREVVLLQQQGEKSGLTLLSRRADGRLQSSLGNTTTIGSTPIEPKKWYHVGLVRDVDQIKLFVNGNVETISYNTEMNSNQNHIIIGADQFPETYNAWPGYVDELQMYDVALTEDQMREAPGFVWPSIRLNGESDMTLALNETYTEKGATASDVNGDDLTVSIQTSGQVDTSKGGIYRVRYTVTNTKGESVAKVRTVTVLPPKTLSRASRVLIDKGLQMQTWMPTEDTGRKYASQKEWENSHFTTATFYESPWFNETLFNSVDGMQWSFVMGEFGGGGLNSGPPVEVKNNGYLTAQQLEHVDDLVTVSIGDEQNYSPDIVKAFAEWFQVSHDKYPDVLVHSNQQSHQWQRDNYEEYMRTAEPDLLTYDDYMFTIPGTDNNLFKSIVDNINDQRTFALRGYDSTGRSPIAFGQYLLGFQTGSTGGATGTYRITESQINGMPFATLTLGGKWLSLFRWEYDNPDVFILFDKDRKPTAQYDQYAEMARQIRNLGPHLVRLNSTDVNIVPGQHMENGKPASNKLPRETSVFDANDRSKHSYLRNVSVQNLGSENDRLNGDALIGYFEPLPGMDSFFGSSDMEYFMVMNGLTSGNGKLPADQHGSGDETKQKIVLELNLAAYAPEALEKVSRDTGKVEPVALKSLGGNRYELDVELKGGVADLFRLDKTKVRSGYVAASSVSVPEVVNLKAGETQTLQANVSPASATEKGVRWVTSNRSIATVDANGKVTAVAGGTAYVTAITVDGNFKSFAKIQVEQTIVPVTGIHVSPPAASLYAGDVMRLTAEVEPPLASNRIVSWSSSNAAVAKVDQTGKVEAIAPGIATITVTSSDGSYKATSAITVINENSEAALSELSVTGGRSNIEFDSNKYDYEVKLNSEVDTIKLQPRMKSGKGNILVNDKVVSSGQLITATVPMGNSLITFVTKSYDGTASKTYRLKVKRNENIARKASAVNSTYSGVEVYWDSVEYDPAGEHSPKKIIDGDVRTYFQSVSVPEDKINAKDEFEPAHRIFLKWDEPQDMNQMVLIVNNAQQQGLKVMDISTTVDGQNWDEMPSGPKLTWLTNNPAVYEEQTILLPRFEGTSFEGIKGLYILLWAANMTSDNRYALSELELYNEKDAVEPVQMTVSDIPATGVQVVPASAELNVSETIRLTAAFTPGNASNQLTEWKSSNTSVATVNANGIVYAVGAGTAVITATTEEGHFTATSTVHVTNPNSDASLASLVVKGAAGDIEFDSARTDYTVKIDSSQDTIQLLPTMKRADSSMKVNGVAVGAGYTVTAKVPMGNSVISIVVTAADGATTQTYRIKVKRNENLARKASAVNSTYSGVELDWNSVEYDPQGEHSPKKIIDGDVRTYFQSVSVPEDKINAKDEFSPPHRIFLKWNEPQDMNQMVLIVNNAQQQGLKVMDISTTVDGQNWDEMPSGPKLTWLTNSPDVYEEQTIALPSFEGTSFEGIKGLYILLWAANMTSDNRYALSELELYNEKDAVEPVQITVTAPYEPPVTAAPGATVGNGVIKAITPNVDAATGVASVSVKESDWKEALSSALPDAKGVRTVRIEVPAATGAGSYVVNLPQQSLNANDPKVKVRIETEWGTIESTSNMLSGMKLTEGQTVALILKTVDVTTLDAALQKKVGRHPVIEVSLLVDGKQVEWRNPKSPVVLTIPYVPTAEEAAHAEHLVVWYIERSGKIVPVPNGKYDPATRTVRFSTTHFSEYAVAFVQTTFKDIGNTSWARKAIEVMASKGIVNGLSESEFRPTARMTRADYVTLLVRAFELKSDAEGANFIDIDAAAYYADSARIAKTLGIVNGTGEGRFNPLKPIARQEALVMLNRAMKAAGKDNEAGGASELERFADRAAVSSYAAESVSALVRAGIVQGDGRNLHPLDTLSRAEAAVLLYHAWSLN
ncbi:Ig-like domain-containing protein [Cohnella soli]|uniref:Ig-like domain-containing protein n=1 Tax=Cohnella soli TaxID=425005 RepID=A0ABW0HSD4_9BACL